VAGVAMTDTPRSTVETDVPARMDRLPWSRWHWTVILGLGLTEAQVGLTASCYVIGAVLTAFSFSPWWFFLMRLLTGAGVGGERGVSHGVGDLPTGDPGHGDRSALLDGHRARRHHRAGTVRSARQLVSSSARQLVSTGSPSAVAMGYCIGAVVMILGGVVELLLGVEASQRSLEDIASPLSVTEGSAPAATG
jgi:hypothetical protein